MEYGNIFWRVRYNIALRYAKRDEKILKLFNDLFGMIDKIPYDKQLSHSYEAYKMVAKNNYMFTRWICPVCFTGFVSVYVFLAYGSFLYFTTYDIQSSLFISFACFVLTYPITSLLMKITG